MENFIFCAVHTGPYSTSYYSKEAFLTKIKIPEISMQKKEKESIMVFSCKFAVYFQNTRTSFQNTSGLLLLNIHTGPCSTSYYLKEDFLIKIECPGTSKQKKREHDLALFSVFTLSLSIQKQPSRGVLRKICSKNMQQIQRRTPMPKFDFKFQ